MVLFCFVVLAVELTCVVLCWARRNAKMVTHAQILSILVLDALVAKNIELFNNEQICSSGSIVLYSISSRCCNAFDSTLAYTDIYY